MKIQVAYGFTSSRIQNKLTLEMPESATGESFCIALCNLLTDRDPALDLSPEQCVPYFQGTTGRKSPKRIWGHSKLSAYSPISNLSIYVAIHEAIGDDYYSMEDVISFGITKENLTNFALSREWLRTELKVLSTKSQNLLVCIGSFDHGHEDLELLHRQQMPKHLLREKALEHPCHAIHIDPSYMNWSLKESAPQIMSFSDWEEVPLTLPEQLHPLIKRYRHGPSAAMVTTIAIPIGHLEIPSYFEMHGYTQTVFGVDLSDIAKAMHDDVDLIAGNFYSEEAMPVYDKRIDTMGGELSVASRALLYKKLGVFKVVDVTEEEESDESCRQKRKARRK